MNARKKTRAKPASAWPRHASVFEVGPRDGLQAEHKILGVPERVELILKLIEAGLKDIEVGSFVKAEWIPQLQNTAEVVARLRERLPAKPGAKFWAFIPNEHGLHQALECGLDGASFFIAASNAFCEKNVNRSQAQILDALKKLVPLAHKGRMKSRVYLSTLVHCPYEGPTPPPKVAALAAKLSDIGVSEIVLSDTTGHATPLSLSKLLTLLMRKHEPREFALHLHDTRGLALANILEAMRFGLNRFDSSIGGTGGCPYAPGATGNLATEDLVYMLQALKIEKAVDLQKLGAAGAYTESILGKQLPSRVLRTLVKQRPGGKNELVAS